MRHALVVTMDGPRRAPSWPKVSSRTVWSGTLAAVVEDLGPHSLWERAERCYHHAHPGDTLDLDRCAVDGSHV